MRRSPLRVAVVALSLLVLTNGLLFLVARRVLESGGTWEDPVVRSPLVATSLVGVGMVALDRHRVSGRRLARPSWLAAAAIAAYSAVAVLSTYWSIAPDLTLWRAATYLGLPLLAWVIADLDDERLGRAFSFVLVVAVVASLVTVVVSPAIGLDVNDDWRGIYTNRNSLAPLAALAIVVGAGYAVRARGRSRAPGAAMALVSFVVLLGTGSRTAWLSLLVALGAGTLVVGARIVQRRGGARRALGLVAGGGTVGVAALAIALSRLWSASTFEQRRTIWSLVWDRVQERPIQGYGFFAVWDVPSFTADHYLLERGSAHGSALEVWLGLGLLGMIPFVVIVGLAIFGASRDAWADPSVWTWVWLVTILFLIVENLTESFVLWFSYNWVLIMAAALRSGMGRERLPDRSRAPSPSPAGDEPRAGSAGPEPVAAGS